MTKMTGAPQIGPWLDVCHDTAQYELGAVIAGANGKKYRYVQFKDAVTYVAGHVVCLKDNDANEWAVTNDVSANMAGDHPVGVVFQSTVPTEDEYGWVQIGGVATVLAGSGSIVAGDYLKPDDTTDGAADEATEGTHENILGIAMEAITDTETGAVLLRGLDY